MLWAGLVLRRTPRVMLERCGQAVAQVLLSQPGRGVLVQHVLGGSPADTRELVAHCFLLEVDGQPVRELEDVLRALDGNRDAADAGVAGKELPRRWVRLRFMDPHGQEHVRALQSDPLYFPTLELLRSGPGRWRCERRDH